MKETKILIYEELEKEDQIKKNKKSNSLFFYYENELYNLDNTSFTNSSYFDCMIKKESDTGNLLIKYDTDDTIKIGEQSCC